MLIFTLCSVQGSWQGLEGQTRGLQHLGLSKDARQGIYTGLGALNPRCPHLFPAWYPYAQRPELGTREVWVLPSWARPRPTHIFHRPGYQRLSYLDFLGLLWLLHA